MCREFLWWKFSCDLISRDFFMLAVIKFWRDAIFLSIPATAQNLRCFECNNCEEVVPTTPVRNCYADPITPPTLITNPATGKRAKLEVYWDSANKMFLNCWSQFRSRHRRLVQDTQDFTIQVKQISQINRCRCSLLKKTFRQLDAIKFLRASQYSAMVRSESSHAPIGVSSFPTTFS